MNFNNEDGTEHLLGKLKQVFADGYRPARGQEPYTYTLNNGVRLYSMVNCFGHIFNLRNEQFNDYEIKPFPLYGYFSNLEYYPNHQARDRMFDFIKATGLKIEECDPKKVIEDFKSWKIALYFSNNKDEYDFHYLLENEPQVWSGKIGFDPCVEEIHGITPPTKYRDLVDYRGATYDFFGTYKVTNPHADGNNRYLKDFKFNTHGLKKPLRKAHLVTEDTRCLSFDSLMEQLFLR